MIRNHLISVRIRVSALRVGGTEYHRRDRSPQAPFKICPRRLTERPGGYDPSDARSSRAGDAAAVAELAMQRLVVPPYAGSSPVSRLKISFF